MLHDSMLNAKRAAASQESGERRRWQRVPFPAELLLRWFYDPTSPVRYRIVDAGAEGFRIRTSVPLLTGMTGIAVKLLPEGTPIERTVTVAWVRPAEPEADEADETGEAAELAEADADGAGGEFEAGLRLM